MTSYDGTIIAISNDGYNSNNGRVQIFERDTNEATGWLQLGNDIVGTAGEKFGQLISLSKNGDIFASISAVNNCVIVRTSQCI